MKWGVRKKYESYTGTYTKAGVKRFNESVNKYKKEKDNYITLTKKSGASRYDVKMAKAKVKSAKQDVSKHYTHLALDKAADKGKLRYNKGERIRENGNLKSNLMLIGSAAAISGAKYLKNSNLISDNIHVATMGLASISTGASIVSKMRHIKSNNELKAYYGHTSNY